MKSEHCSSFATSSSRHSQTSGRRWRRRHPRAEPAATGSPACACGGSSPAARATPRAPSPSLPCRTPASARRPPAARTRTPPRPPPPPPRPPPRRHGRARSRTNCGRCSMSSSAREAGCATTPRCCAGSSTSRTIPPRSRSRASSRSLRAATASRCSGCGASVTRCSPARHTSKRRRPPPPHTPRPAPPPPPRTTCPSAGSIPSKRHRFGRRAFPRPTPGSSRRFFSRVIPSNFNGNFSHPPFKIR